MMNWEQLKNESIFSHTARIASLEISKAEHKKIERHRTAVDKAIREMKAIHAKAGDKG